MGCDLEEVISDLPDEVLARICGFLNYKTVLSLRSLSKAVNARLDRGAFIWILSAARMGLADFLQSTTSVARWLAAERPDQLALAFLTQWYRKERLWRRQDYDSDTLFMLKDKAHAHPYRSKTVETKVYSSHIDQLGSRSSSVTQLLATGNSEHYWRVVRGAIPCVSGRPALQDFSSPVFVEESQPDLGSVRAFYLFWLHHAGSLPEKPADVSPTSSVSGDPLKSKVVFCWRMVVPRTVMKSLPPALSISLPPRTNGGDHSARGSTWAGYVDLRPRNLVDAGLTSSPPFPPSLVINWDPVLMEAAPGAIRTKALVKARISAHLVRRNEPVETLGPPAVVFSWEMGPGDVNDRVVALSAIAVVEQLEAMSCRWLVVAGTESGRVLFSVSEGSTNGLLQPKAASSPSFPTSNQFTCREVHFERLPVAQLCLSFHEFGEDGSAEQVGRSLSIFCQFQTAAVCVYRTPLPGGREAGSQSLLDGWLSVPWCCVARIQDPPSRIDFAGWSAPMDQLVLGTSGMDSLEEAKYLLVVVPRVTSRGRAAESIAVGKQAVLRVEKSAEDCDVVESQSDGDCPRMVSLSSAEAKQHVARLRCSNISQAHAMSFLRCWVFVTEKCLRVIEGAVHKGKKKTHGLVQLSVKAVLAGHQGNIQACATDGFHKFASACSAGDIIVWDIARCVRLTRLKLIDPHGLPPPSRGGVNVRTDGAALSEERHSKTQVSLESGSSLLDSPEFPALGRLTDLVLHTPPLGKKCQTSYAEKSRERDQMMEKDQVMGSSAKPNGTYDKVLDEWHCAGDSLGMELRDFSRCYEAQLMFDVQPNRDPSSSSSMSFEEQQETLAAMEGWSLPGWLAEQKARFNHLSKDQIGAVPTAHPRKMVSLVTRKIFSSSFEHDFELPVEHEGQPILIELPRDLKRAIAENKKSHRSENLPVSSYRPRVSQLFLDDQHIGVFFTSCRTWQVWNFFNGTKQGE